MSDKNKEKATEETADEKFLDAVIGGSTEKIGGIILRPPTLATLAILMKSNNALITGDNLTDGEVMMHVLTFMYVHHADTDEVHGASITQPIAGKNMTLERKALEMGEKLPFKSTKDFVKLYEELVQWLAKHMDMQVEPIADESGKGKKPNPNE